MESGNVPEQPESISPLDETEQPVSVTTIILHLAQDIVETIVISLVIFFIVNSGVGRVRIESISMEPTLFGGELVIVNKLASFLIDYQRGDVIIFNYPLNPSEQYIKRIIGLPGNTVTIQRGRVSINGVVLDEPYIMAPPDYSGSWTVPKDSYFVLGDNRNRSSDSHIWGMLPVKNVVGKAIFIYYPFDQMGIIRGRPQAAQAHSLP
ncbi:MAG: signal peptidase I [Chloroflexota bacterium]